MSGLALIATLVASVLLTSFISGLFGMAGGLILMGILLALMPVNAAMVLHGLIQLVSNGWRAWLWRSHVLWPVVLRFAIGAVLAFALMWALQLVLPKPFLLIALGLLPFTQYAVPKNWRLDITKPFMAPICGFLTTLTHLLAGVSGPVLDQFFVNSALDRRQQVATKAATQTLAHPLKVIYFGSFGLDAFSNGALPCWGIALCLLAAMLGNTLAAKPLEALSNLQFRRYTQTLLALIGLFYLGQGLYLLLRH